MVQLLVRRGHGVVAAPKDVHLSPRGDFWGAEGAAFCRWTRRSRNETCSYVVVDLKNVELVVIHVNRARFWTERHCAMLNCVEFDRTADARSEPQMGRYDVRRHVTEPVRSTDCGRAAARRRSTRRDRSGSSPCTKSQPRRARSRSARRAAPRRPRSRTSALSRDLGVSAIVTRDQGRVNGDPCKLS